MFKFKISVLEDIEEGDDDAFFEGDGESLMDQELMEEDGPVNTGDNSRTPETFAIANVSCHYDGSAGNMSKCFVTVLLCISLFFLMDSCFHS